MDAAFANPANAANVGGNEVSTGAFAALRVAAKVAKRRKRGDSNVSQRPSGSRGVSDLCISTKSAGVVIAGMAFGHIVAIDLGGSGSRVQSLVKAHHGSVEAVAPHPTDPDRFATVGLDCLLCLWDVSKKSLLHQKSLTAPGMAVDIRAAREDAEHVAVGFTVAAVGIYSMDRQGFLPEPRVVRLPGGTGESVSMVKYSPDGFCLAVCSHDTNIYLLDVAKNYALRKRLKGHSATVHDVDWSKDGRVLQSTCAGYEILYWDVEQGKRFSSTHDSVESDTLWASWTLTLGFPVMGVWDPASDGTDVNAAHRSSDGSLVLTGDDEGFVSLFSAPVVCRHAAHRRFNGHSSHCQQVRWLAGGDKAASVGGRDAAVLLWRLDDASDRKLVGEDLVKPSAARAAWMSGCDLVSTVDILAKPRPLA
mmetsp:Transcript_7038/g.24793  ORF Transcript_7038/g.24793 Transcript_7038/m.24793 type:complete len:420 (-) Transcript_7038:24-1283(-)